MSSVNQAVPASDETPPHQPYIPDEQSPPEFTWPAVLTGALFGIVFGASSLYLLLKVGMTVSASVPIAVLSITLFRFFSKTFGFRRATILENNIVQTAGSAGESIAFGVGVTMPALLLLGFEMDPVRVTTVSVLGGLLGILMMIPLRRAFIVKQHGNLKYPEGTACAEVLIAGEKGGSTARMVFIGFGIAAAYTFLMKSCKFWSNEPSELLYTKNADGTRSGLNGAQAGVDVSPELLGVGFLIGPRIACLMMGGALLSYFAIGPLIANFGAKSSEPVPPVEWEKPEAADRSGDPNLIRNMEPSGIKNKYLKFIGAGAVAAGGIISMLRALPLIFASITGGIRDLRASRASGGAIGKRTETDLSMNVVLYGSIALVLVLAAVPQLGLGFNLKGVVGALMILLFGFLFVTVSSRLTGEVGSSSNPISGMTIATLLLVCLIFFVLDKRDSLAMLTALTVSAVVCIASSNGGTTSQDLKTGFLVGATPKKQQLAIMVGALVSAAAIAGTMLLLNEAQTHYTKKNLPTQVLNVPEDPPIRTVGKPYLDDKKEYRIVHIRKDDTLNPGVAAGRYLVGDDGKAAYRTDTPVDRQETTMDNGVPAPKKYDAPQPQLFASIIEGILGGKLEWSLIIIGVMIAFSLELAGVPSLPVAVGMYLPLTSSTPIFVGGIVRWLVDKINGKSASEAETETSPSVLLASGFIAGGTLCGLIISFFNFLPDEFNAALSLGPKYLSDWDVDKDRNPKIVAMIMYALLIAVLMRVGLSKRKVE
ncbi:MAG: oligopeptide transporter, OPT family [Planctomycetes bacterium]|nr:oligopeptide transporter, OPT family [Planctomycetota bacterium]